MMDRYSMPGSQQMGQDPTTHQQPTSSDPSRRQPFAWWAALTAPHYDEATLRDPRMRERYRRAQLASAVIPVLFLLVLIQLKNAFVNPPTALGLGVLVGACIVGMILNRAGFVSTAGVLLVVALIFAIVAALYNIPGGLSLIWLPVFDVLTLCVIIAGLLLPRWMTFVTALAVSVISTVFIVLAPRATDLATFIQTYGYAPVVLRIYANFWMSAILVFLLSRSIELAIARADRAEDLARAEAQIARQAQYIAEQNARLEYGIQQLLETHRRVAAGDFSVRTPTQQDNELWQIGVSLNNLISRFSRLAASERRLVMTEEALRAIAMQIDIARRGGQPQWPMLTGTPADQILQALGVAPPPSIAEAPPGMASFGPAPSQPPALPGSSGPGQPRAFGSWTDPIE
jgi:HAMP domain-containing protein